jgi:metallophosphoesterase superfamily enzyme
MELDQLIEKFSKRHSYLIMGSGKIAKQFNADRNDVKIAKNLVQAKLNYELAKGFTSEYHLAKMPESNVLIIGDLHAPFIKDGYLEFCKEIYKKYNCNEVVFIGDIVDSHFSSFHDADPDGHSAGEELKKAIVDIQDWYSAFPVAKVCLGNHDLIPNRKAFNAGLSKRWIKTMDEVLKTPNWTYDEEFIINKVLYTHGTGRKAAPRMKADLISIVQGHYHSESYVQYSVGKFSKLFAMQVGCGVDDKSYAMAYGKHFNKSHINCGVVLEDGKLPILEYMNL